MRPPRMRGKYGQKPLQQYRIVGPSPPAQEVLLPQPTRADVGGAIPASAGVRQLQPDRYRPAGSVPASARSKLRARTGGSARWIHPRIRGKYSAIGFIGGQSRGPSLRTQEARQLLRAGGQVEAFIPHTREARRQDARLHLDDGPIPACARSTRRSSGTGVTRGSIPACAGSTAPSASRSRRSRVHPRVRGKYGRWVDAPVLPLDPSLHAREASLGRQGVHQQVGSIPAYAGIAPPEC